MNIKMFFFLPLLVAVIIVKGNMSNTGFDKFAFYSALATNDLETINTQLSIVRTSSVSEKEAYEGTLLMKKAGLVTKAKEKLTLFKAGRLKLEASIKKNNGNPEFNFLRLIIQEHAPKIVDYRNNLENDASVVRSNYKTLPQVVQQAINDYNKKSRILKLLSP